MGDRRDIAQQPPDRATDHARFPSARVDRRRRWFRHHRRRRSAPDQGAWFFSSSPATAPSVGSGRFDLAQPGGTCYLASTATSAVLELVGPEFVRHGWVSGTILDARVVSSLSLPEPVRAAALDHPQASSFRVSAELFTMSDYATTQAWARAFSAAGFGGILTRLRFSPGGARGLALFGDAGVPSPPRVGDPRPVPARSLLDAMGIEIVDPPHSSAVVITDP